MDVREKLIEILRKPIFPHELADPKPVGNARKLFCENWGCKVGKDGGGEIQRLFD